MLEADAQMYATGTEEGAKKEFIKLIGKVAQLGTLGMSGQITWSQALSELEFLFSVPMEEEDDN